MRNQSVNAERSGARKAEQLVRCAGCAFEALEARRVFVVFTPEEVYLSELINRARQDPAAEADRLETDLTDGLDSGEFALFHTSREPLALNALLSAASRAHSLDMPQRGFFDHVNPDGLNPTQRAHARGYSGSAGENIGAGHTTIDQLYADWMSSVANRLNILSLFEAFDDDYHYDELGPGFATGIDPLEDHFTAMFGVRGAASTHAILGVVFDDMDGDDFYSIGEGVAGVRIDAALASDPDDSIATFTTDSSGNYQMWLAPGEYVVTMTDADGFVIQESVTLSTRNVRLTGESDDFGLRPGDDHPDAGQFDFATPVALDADGDGATTGGLDIARDTDLFVLETLPRAGELRLVLGPSASLRAELTLFDAAGNEVATAAASGPGAAVSLAWNADAGEVYSLLVSSVNAQTLGSYSLTASVWVDEGGGEETDDHADDGQYSEATAITLGDAGAGVASGELESATDSDLFYFTTTAAGEVTVTVSVAANLAGAITLRNSAGMAVAVEQSMDRGATLTLRWTAPEGEQFFLSIASGDGASTGTYSIAIATTPEDSGGGGGGGGNEDPEDDAPTSTASDSSGAFYFVRPDSDGRPILFIQNEQGGWDRVDLISEAGGPTPEGRFASWVDPQDDGVSIASATASGLVVYSKGDDGRWSVRNLSAELGADPIDSGPVVFTSRDGLIFIAGLTEDGRLITYQQTGELTTGGEQAWAAIDLTTDHLGASGLTMPELDGASLMAYVTAWNALTIAALDAEGQIQAIWWAPGMERWTISNLSEVTGAPAYFGRITSYLTPWKGINIAGTDANGDLTVVWWVPSFGGDWRLSNFNQLFDGPRLEQGTLASYVTPWGGLNITGVDEDGRVVVYWWAPGLEEWSASPLSDLVTNVDPPVRNVNGHTSARGVITIVGQTELGQLVRYWWMPGGQWTGEAIELP